MNLAILIDAENVLPSHADMIFAHAAKLGTITHKEIFGAASALTSWVAPVLKYAIHPNLTIKAAKGKNSSDIALVIGAMDLLVTGGIDTVIIASSDSDFSSLSVRLRNAGIDVIGMGTEKANALWRTACSSFVVLQNQKAAQPAKQPQQQQQPKQAQPAKQAQPQQQPQQQQQKQAKQPAKKQEPAETHETRVAVISQAISQQLESLGGRVQTSTLFPALNKLPEYRRDRQAVSKKPLNYLTSTYGDTFHFEDAPDGQNWVSLPGVTAEAEAPAQAEAPAEREVPVEAEAPVEPEVPVEVEVEEAPEAPETVQAAEESVAEEAESEGYVTPQEIVEKLVAGGFEEEIARQVTDIFADSASYRSAYNRLRSVFGNNTGRDYYQQAKQILTQE